MKVNIAKWPKRAVAAILAVLLAITFLPFSNFNLVTAKADAGDPPAHSKTANDNGDGTYKLELSVTGDADNETQEAGGVNIVVVYDISQSMSTNAGSSRYSRADQAEDVMHDFLTNLATYQNAAKDNIRVSLVNFAVTASQIQGWSTDVTALANRFDDGGTDGSTNFTYNGYGTNWEHALQRAQTLVNSVTNSDPVFVIMLTDGAPTASGTSGSDAIAPTGATIQQLRTRYNAATNEAYTIASACEGTGGTFYGIYAYGTEADLLDDLMYYSKNNQHRGGNINNVVAATEDAPNYFNAGETAQLQSAIDEIFDKVVQAMGISAVSISDGTTHQVTTSTGDISELLDVDTSSYQYWLSIPVVNNQFQRVDRDGNTITYTVTDNGDGTCTVTWPIGHSVTVDGSVSKGQFKYEWTEANDLYNYNPPAAVFNNSKVDWNLSSVGTLLDGVTYSVTFDVYPSQTTLDYVADIKNDPGADGAWGDLDSEIQKYIDVDGKLKTNTTATLTYSDTRLDEQGPYSSSFTNPDPVENSAVEQLTVAKEWENVLDEQEAEPIDLTVTCDGKDKYTMTLGEPEDPEDPDSPRDWSDNVFISIGILRHAEDGAYTDSAGEKFEVLEPGHEFTFKEPSDLGYYWELEVPIVRPMMVDGTVTMLILKGAAPYDNPEGTTEYTILGKTYYVGATGAASLTATNHRRARLNLKKVVDGEDADPDQTFPFTLNVVDSKANEGSADNLNSDYYVWFSVYNGGYVDAVVSGAEKEIDEKTGAWTGFYYAPSGTDIVVNLKADDNLRFLNLPAGSTYTFTEGALPNNYAFTSSVLKAKTWDKDGQEVTVPNDEADPEFSGKQTTQGNIVLTNTDYTVTYTNTYGLTDVEITKEWVDYDDADELRPTADEFKEYLKLMAGSTDVTSANASKLVVTDNGDNTYTAKWTGLDRYVNGEEIKYTVEETTIDDYTTTGSPAQDHGKIINTHVPSTEATVKKIWVGDGTIPDSLEVTLKKAVGDKDPEVVDTYDLNADNSWTYTVNNLPKYDETTGDTITYSWSEDADALEENYDYKLTDTSVSGTVTTLTNTYSPKNTKVSVLKVWNDGEDQDGLRPKSLAVTLYQTVGDGEPEVVDTYTLNDANEWTYTTDFLPLADEEGNSITYTWEEASVTGYTPSSSTEGTLTTFTNTHTPATTNVSIHKVWVDGGDKDGVRPQSLEVTLNRKVGDGEPEAFDKVTLDADNEWTDGFEGLPLYQKVSGVSLPVTYTWVEPSVAGYALTGNSTDDEGVTTITNTRVSDIVIEKTWVDSDNKYGLRPSNDKGIKVTLYKGEGEAKEKVSDVTVKPNDAGEWKLTIPNLPKYDANGEIKYSVEEEAITGYTATYDGLKITNTLALGDLTITKDLTAYNNFVNQTVTAEADPVTFIFRVSASLGAWEYDDYVSLTFNAAGSDSIVFEDAFPVGADVTVVEVYSGSGYINTDEAYDPERTWTGTITDGETADAAVANFTNAYGNKIKNGYGIQNHYSDGKYVPEVILK